jgi:uncharacterized membrane protein YdjX (TVP38/TMEM64 family)
MSPPALRPVLGAVRSAGAAVAATAGQLSRTRVVVTALGAAAVIAFVLAVPLPTAVQVRDWAASSGPWFPLAFFTAHVVATVLPVPRTAFTLAAGLLFGPALGVVGAVAASTCSALIALVLVRAAGWQIGRIVSHPGLDALDAGLRTRGWPAVLSLRLIPAVPFSVLNYAAGASAIGVGPYLGATVLGLIPGTAAVVILGDALTGDVSPLLILVSVCTGSLGIAGLIHEGRRHRRHRSRIEGG